MKLLVLEELFERFAHILGLKESYYSHLSLNRYNLIKRPTLATILGDALYNYQG